MIERIESYYDSVKNRVNFPLAAIATSIALITTSVSSGCSRHIEQQNQSESKRIDSLEDTKKRQEEAKIEMEKSKSEFAKAKRELDLTYKETEPYVAQFSLEKARERATRAQEYGDAFDKEIAKENLEEQRRACRLAREGYKERNGSYPDLNCEE